MVLFTEMKKLDMDSWTAILNIFIEIETVEFDSPVTLLKSCYL